MKLKKKAPKRRKLTEGEESIRQYAKALREEDRRAQRWADMGNALVPHAPEIMQGPAACSPKVRKMFHDWISASMEPSPLLAAIRKKKRRKRR